VPGLIGPNGSGNTTLCECLRGVWPADGGTLRREGRPLTTVEIYVDSAVRFIKERPALGLYRHDPFEEAALLKDVFARALAHEIGHLLLGRQHARTGLMCPRMSWRDGVHLTSEGLVLTTDQRLRLLNGETNIPIPTSRRLAAGVSGMIH
jgi:energy-coupling factor transporter ATP-binding protein EcfA2